MGGRVALVTGAGARIGQEIARDLGKRGWTVLAHYRNSHQGIHDTLEAIRSEGGNAYAVQADLADETDLDQMIKEAIDLAGRPTLLVNNASSFEKDDVFSADPASWDLHMDVNLRAPFRLSQLMAEGLRECGASGNIINMIDMRVWRLNPTYMTYTLSKSALWTLTQTLAQALAPYQIRVNGIGPGPAMKNIRQTSEDFAEQAASTLLKRGTSPAEICHAVQFILDSPAMTGQMIALDGGQHLAWETPDVINVKE